MDISQAFLNFRFVELVNGHDAHRRAALFSDDAVLVPAGQPTVIGREVATKIWNHLEELISPDLARTTSAEPPGGFRNGSWLCDNPKTLERDRRTYSSKIVLALRLAGAFNLDGELKNAILVVFRSCAFLHSQGHF
ncbi:hypothetical protein AC630_41080, partial [Bradyrhizobium sp. AS23.2]